MKTIISTNIRFFILALTLALVAPACAVGGEDDELGSTDSEVAARPRFEMWQNAGGQYYWHFLASNHEVLLASEGYQNRVGALTGMLSVLDNGGFASRYQVSVAADGQYHFNLVAANNEIIASSELYSTKSNANKAVTAATNSVASYVDHMSGTGARFTVFTGANNRFYFRLYAKNGEIVLSSQGYDTEAGAYNGAYSVKDNGLATSAYPITKSASGQWHFNLVAANGEIIGSSEMYATKQKAQQGRDAIIALLPKLSPL